MSGQSCALTVQLWIILIYGALLGVPGAGSRIPCGRPEFYEGLLWFWAPWQAVSRFFGLVI